ncbi:MAG: ATP-binding protein [Duganella sp.]
MRPWQQSRELLALGGCAVIMAAIFVADTLTQYAVAVAVFYTLVILAAVRWLAARTVVALAGVSVSLTVLSFCLTPHGDYELGMINSGISILAIAVTTYLALKMAVAQTAAQQAQAQLLRLARISSLGELTASIAHEVNQPLAAIVTSGNACQRWLAQEPPNLDKAQQALARMLGDADRASNIVLRVRGLTKRELPRKIAFDLNVAVQEIVALSDSELERYGISLSLSLDPAMPWVLADRVQIQQVIGNLLLNAMESLAARPEGSREISIVSAGAGRDSATLSIADSGIGLPAGVGDGLFEAFWTSKDGGIGLGLTISRNIIEANSGMIRAEAAPGGGAVFTFSVPVTKAVPA